MRIIETKAYQLHELSSEAQEKAIDNFRNHESYLDYGWWDFVYEDAKIIASLFGLEIDEIYFSGFYSQGDGACFEGYYSYKKGGLKAVEEYAPTDMELYGIVKGLQDIQRKYFYGLTASTKHRGHYCHSGCMAVSVYQNAGMDYANIDVEREITDLLRQFADWIYSKLKDEYKYLMSDEAVRATIELNEYEFDEEGNWI